MKPLGTTNEAVVDDVNEICVSVVVTDNARHTVGELDIKRTCTGSTK